MKTIGLHLQKGGVGKTTIAGSLAFELAYNNNKKVMLIDADPQSNITSWFAHNNKKIKYELSDMLTGKADLLDTIVYNFSRQAGDNLEEECVLPSFDLIPSFGLDGQLRLYGETKLADEPYIFCDLVKKLKLLKYDYVIFDMSPSIGRLEKSILMSLSEVITPLTPEYFSIDGLQIFDFEIDKIHKNFKKKIKHEMIILNAYDARIKQHVEIKKQALKLKYKVFVLPVDPAYRKAQAMHDAVQNYNLKAESKNVLSQIVNELESN